MNKIAFVVDGNQELGMGHVIHSLALAEELKDKAEILLVTQSGKEIAAIWEEKGFTVYNVKNAKAKLKGLSPQIVVIDQLYVDSDFAEWVRYILGARLVICNCLSNDALTIADLVVAGDAMGLQNRRMKAPVYDRRDPRQFADYSSLWLTGPKYWVLRPEFLNYLSKVDFSHIIAGTIDATQITVSPNFSENLGDKIQKTQKQSHRILVRIGGVDQDLVSQIDSILGNFKVDIITNYQYGASEMAEKMVRADVVICTPGLTPFESLLVGTPVIIIPQNEEQELRYKPTLPLLSKDDIDKLPSIIERGEFIRPDSPVVQRMQIGQGKQEVVEAIEQWL